MRIVKLASCVLLIYAISNKDVFSEVGLNLKSEKSVPMLGGSAFIKLWGISLLFWQLSSRKNFKLTLTLPKGGRLPNIIFQCRPASFMLFIGIEFLGNLTSPIWQQGFGNITFVLTWTFHVFLSKTFFWKLTPIPTHSMGDQFPGKMIWAFDQPPYLISFKS